MSCCCSCPSCADECHHGICGAPGYQPKMDPEQLSAPMSASEPWPSDYDCSCIAICIHKAVEVSRATYPSEVFKAVREVLASLPPRPCDCSRSEDAKLLACSHLPGGRFLLTVHDDGKGYSIEAATLPLSAPDGGAVERVLEALGIIEGPAPDEQSQVPQIWRGDSQLLPQARARVAAALALPVATGGGKP